MSMIDFHLREAFAAMYNTTLAADGVFGSSELQQQPPKQLHQQQQHCPHPYPRRPSLQRDYMGETPAPRCRTSRDIVVNHNNDKNSTTNSHDASHAREIPSCSATMSNSGTTTNHSSSSSTTKNTKMFGVVHFAVNRWLDQNIANRFRLTASRELVLPAIGMFFFYVCHDALQEKMFRFEGFKFGWFMTLAEVVVMIMGALASEGVSRQLPPGGKHTWAVTAMIGLCVALSHGCGNTALRFSSYPLKVAFKSCKLVPTMAIGFFINGRRHSLSAYCAALVMCVGLFLLSISDAATPKSAADKLLSTPREVFLTSIVGPLLLFLSTSMDSVVPNLQEHLFSKTNMRTVDMIFLSNVFMVLLLFLFTVTSGELRQALAYCLLHPRVLAVLTLQSASAYCGLRCYLTVIKKLGGAAGVLLANARKIVTILLSFVLFRKPCRPGHVSGLCLIFVGVYLGLVNKQGKKKKSKKDQNSSDTDSTLMMDNSNKRDHNV